ncbi:hypothetical protein Tco_0988093 [Tanacetum coccineum]|uniref:Uncharacterized protein n=1 Tax=Tanacetum coccineum TaxID=301880 RepID=A0ABQ5EQD1_9ASTR
MVLPLKARFGGNEATKKTQKALLKQQYENFNASSSESLDSIFNRLQKLVSRLAILGVVTPPEDLNVKFLRSLPSDWIQHVVKRSAGANNDDKNLAFLTTSGASSTNNINTVNPEVSTARGQESSIRELEGRPSLMEAILLDIINQSSSKAVRIEDASERVMCTIDGVEFDWCDNGRGKKFKQNGLSFAFSDSDGHKEYQMGLLRTELEKVKEEKEGFEFKIAKFEKSAKDLDQLLASQITDKSKKGFGYNVVPSPHPLILNRPTPLDLSYSGLEEFKQPEVNEYGPRDSSVKPTTGCDKESDNSKENTDDSLKQQQKTDSSSVKSPLKVDKDWKEKFFCPANHVREEEPKKARENNDAPIIEDWVSDDEDEVEPIPKVEKKTVIPTATKKEFVKPEKQVRRSVRYAEMYRSQRPRGNQRNWNGQKSNQLGCSFVFNNNACFIYGSFDHIQYNCPKHMVPRAFLMKTGLKLVNTVRSINTDRPFSTARSFNTVRPSYTAHPKSTIHCARPRTYFQNQAQSTVHRPFYKKTALTNRCLNKRFNTSSTNSISTVSSTINNVRERGFNDVKPSACWIWRPIKPNGASLVFNKYNYIDARGRSKSVMAWVPKEN